MTNQPPSPKEKPPETTLVVKVTPNARQAQIQPGTEDGIDFRISVTVVPEDGKANAAVVKLLSKHLKVPKSRLVLVRGATARVKVFRVDPA